MSFFSRLAPLFALPWDAFVGGFLYYVVLAVLALAGLSPPVAVVALAYLAPALAYLGLVTARLAGASAAARRSA